MSKTHRYYTEEFLDDLYRTAQLDDELLKQYPLMGVSTSTISPSTSTNLQEDLAFEKAIYESLKNHKAENAKRGAASTPPTSKEEHYSELNSKLAKANADPEAPVYSGIGVEVVYNERAKGFEVISAYKNCANGLQVGDIITHITNPETGKPEWLGARGDDETSQLMRGEVGSKAQLTILRNGQEKTLDITRKVIDVKKQAAFDFPGAVRLLVMEKEVAQMKEMLKEQSRLLTEQGQALKEVTAENKTLRERIEAIDLRFNGLAERVGANETGLSRLSEKVERSGDEGQDVPANVAKALGVVKTELGVQINEETRAREKGITGLKVEIEKKASAEDVATLQSTTQQLSEGQGRLEQGRREDLEELVKDVITPLSQAVDEHGVRLQQVEDTTRQQGEAIAEGQESTRQLSTQVNAQGERLGLVETQLGDGGTFRNEVKGIREKLEKMNVDFLRQSQEQQQFINNVAERLRELVEKNATQDEINTALQTEVKSLKDNWDHLQTDMKENFMGTLEGLGLKRSIFGFASIEMTPTKKGSHVDQLEQQRQTTMPFTK